MAQPPAGTPASTILVVDDEPEVRRAVAMILQRRLGARVLEAHDPDAAFDLMARHTVDLIISDHRMGAMDGTDFLARCAERAPSVPRFLMSGYTDLAVAQRAVNEARISRLLQKPISSDELVRTVLEVLDASARQRHAQTAFARSRALMDEGGGPEK